MNLDDLWIGDVLKIRSSGKVGKFHGEIAGNALIQIDGNIVEIDPKDIQLLEQEPNSEIIQLSEELTSIDLKKIAEFNPVLDLHKEVLIKRGYHIPDGTILTSQIRICKKYIDEAALVGLTRIRIIHGMGSGILRNEIELLLEESHIIREFESTADGGAFIAYL